MPTAFAGFWKRPYEYLGMIGSKNKVRITRENLLKEGYSLEELDQVHAPTESLLADSFPRKLQSALWQRLSR